MVQTKALQCPLSGGGAVFKARALYSMVNDTLAYYDQAICLQQGILMRRQQASLIAVYPNPASDKATLEYSLPEGSKGALVLYNTLGRQVNRIELRSENSFIEFSTARLAEGMYYYSVVSGSDMIGSGKLTIIR